LSSALLLAVSKVGRNEEDLWYFVNMFQYWFHYFRVLWLLIPFLLFCVDSMGAEPSLGAAQSEANAQIEQYLQMAQEAEKSKDYTRMVDAYLGILNIRPDWALIHQSLGVAYHLQSRYPQAIAAFEKALTLDPQLWGAHLFLGMDFYRTNQFARAIPELKKAIELNPTLAEAEARQWLGFSFLALKRYGEAIEQWQRLVELKPRDLEALYNLAQAYHEVSTSLFEAMGRIDMHSAEAHRIQAEWFESQDRPVLAIEEYEKAAALRPDWEGLHSAIGRIYASLGELEKAAKGFEEELRMSPNDEELRKKLSALQERLKQATPSSERPADSTRAESSAVGASTQRQYSLPGQKLSSMSTAAIEKFRARQFNGAIDLLKKALATNPEDRKAGIYLARCYFSLENYEHSVAILQSLAKTEAQDPEVMYWLGRSYQELAAFTLQKMVEIDPSSYRVHQMAGKLYEEKAQFAKALDSYKTALTLAPNLAGIRSDIGNICRKMQNLDEALIWLKEELKINPYHALTSFRVGDIYLTKASPDLAIPYLEQAVQANPELLEAQRELGKALMDQQQYEKALPPLKVVAEEEPEDEGIHYLLSGAYRKLGKSEEARLELERFKELNEKRLERDRQRVERKILRDASQ
jgi:superkiller protein 3